MAENLRDVQHVNARIDADHGEGMPQAVEREGRQSGRGHQAAEGR
jgi:hypothetical protein